MQFQIQFSMEIHLQIFDIMSGPLSNRDKYTAPYKNKNHCGINTKTNKLQYFSVIAPSTGAKDELV